MSYVLFGGLPPQDSNSMPVHLQTSIPPPMNPSAAAAAAAAAQVAAEVQQQQQQQAQQAPQQSDGSEPRLKSRHNAGRKPKCPEAVKPHQCQHCFKFFASVHQLMQHSRSHTGEKPYKCTYCERGFRQLSHLQQHTRLHTGERPYKCQMPECSRAFTQLSNLQQHLKNHDDHAQRAKNRPYHCALCGKGFNMEASLHMHTSKQHAGLVGTANTLSCPVCYKMVLGSRSLLDHMRTVHEESCVNVPPNAAKRRKGRPNKQAAQQLHQPQVNGPLDLGLQSACGPSNAINLINLQMHQQ